MSDSNPGPSGLFATKSQKGRRKISLPWFRNNSVNPPHPALSRQHTIDSPASLRTPNNKQKYQVGLYILHKTSPSRVVRGLQEQSGILVILSFQNLS